MKTISVLAMLVLLALVLMTGLETPKPCTQCKELRELLAKSVDQTESVLASWDSLVEALEANGIKVNANGIKLKE